MNTSASLSILILSLVLYFFNRNHKNVCKSFDDYYTDRDENENCYYNPEASMNASQIIRSRGYSFEAYSVTTKDGYILKLFRIPHGKITINDSAQESRQPTFIQHGVGHNSESFINTGNKSLGLILADAGYDVWLGNFRGTVYSQNHLELSPTDERFWSYSIDDVALYDIPAFVNLIADITKQKLIYIGYSAGSTVGLMYGTTYPQTAKDKIKGFVLFSPAAFLSDATPYTKRILSLLCSNKPTLDWLTNRSFNPRVFHNSVRKYLCLPFSFQMRFCQFIDMLSWGFNYEQSNPETLPITLLKNSDLISTDLGCHLVQLMTNEGKFEAYNHGLKKNKERYGTSQPLQYNLTKFNVPVHLIASKNDLLVRLTDVEKLSKALPKDVILHDTYVINDPYFNHGDFITAKDVVPLVYDHVLKIIKFL